MPGIVGIIAKGPGGKHQGDTKLMIESMLHEPFYRSGFYANEALGVYAGWACHQNSYADCMPALNTRQDIVLLFAGEDFSERSDVDHRTAKALLERYEDEGEQFLRGLNGWFS